MTIFKQKKFYFIIILIAAGGYFGYTKYLQSKAPPVYDTVKVERGTLVQSVDATGQIQSAQDLSLKFEIPGILNEVKVKEGDKVKIGQILATLRLSELNAAVAQSQANLNKQLAGSTPEYIAQLQSALDKAKTDLNQAKGNGDGVESSKLVQNTYDNLSATLQSVQVVLASSITAADNILGIDNTLANDVYENYLSGRDPSILTFAKQKYLEVKKAKDGFDIATNALSVNADHKITDEAAQKGVSALVAMKDCLFFVSAVLDNTTPVGVLPQDTLTSMKSSIQTTRTTLATKYAALLTDIHSIDTARNNYYSLQTLVDRAQAALQDAKNPPRAVDVASYRAALDQAIANRDKAIIKAPIDGVITRVNSKVGETVSGADVVIKLLSPHYEISVDISETDIAKLELNDAVVMTLDAFGEDVKFTGKVFNIDPGSTVIQDVVYYKVKISIDDTDKAIKPGMTANVIIKTDSRENALFLPSRAVRTNGEKTVRVLENGQDKIVPVELGIKGDDGKVEVLSGLIEGQEIILGLKQ